jgi:hypothetical protein
MSNTKWLPEEVIETFKRLIAKQTGIVIWEQDRDSFYVAMFLSILKILRSQKF